MKRLAAFLVSHALSFWAGAIFCAVSMLLSVSGIGLLQILIALARRAFA